MSQFVQGPRWPVRKIDALVAREQRFQRCWRVKKYLGSMLTFDFGERIIRSDLRGRALELGSSRLGVRDCAWRVEAGGLRLESDEADRETSELLTRAFDGATITRCERRRPWLTFSFSNGARLDLDITNRYEAEADEFVASLSLSGGASFEMLADGVWELVPIQDVASPHVQAA